MTETTPTPSLAEAASTLLLGAIIGPDPRMDGTTDCYLVALDDMEALRAALAAHERERAAVDLLVVACRRTINEWHDGDRAAAEPPPSVVLARAALAAWRALPTQADGGGR